MWQSEINTEIIRRDGLERTQAMQQHSGKTAAEIAATLSKLIGERLLLTKSQVQLLRLHLAAVLSNLASLKTEELTASELSVTGSLLWSMSGQVKTLTFTLTDSSPTTQTQPTSDPFDGNGDFELEQLNFLED